MQYGHCVTWATATAINCFVFGRNRTFSEDALAERLEGFGRSGRQSVSLLGDLPSRLRIHLFVF